jgi:hypothetical protein
VKVSGKLPEYSRFPEMRAGDRRDQHLRGVGSSQSRYFKMAAEFVLLGNIERRGRGQLQAVDFVPASFGSITHQYSKKMLTTVFVGNISDLV